MIIVKIDNHEVEFSEVSPQWIIQQIDRRRADGLSPNVIIRINVPEINIILSTPTGANNFGGSDRVLTEKEQKIFELWNKLNLNKTDFSSGNLIAFIQQLRHFLNK